MGETVGQVLGFVPFDGVSLAAVLTVAAIYLSAFFIKGAIGFGNLSIMVVFSALVLPPHHAVLIAAVTVVISQVQYIPQAVRDGDWRITRPVLASYFIFSVIGIWLFGRIDAAWLSIVLGISLGLILAVDLLDGMSWVARRIDLQAPRVLYPFCALSGFVSGLTGAGGLFFIALYVKQVAPEPRRFRGTVLQLGVLLTVWRLIVLIANDLITLKIFAETVSLLPAVFAGGAIGTLFYRRLPTKQFFLVIQIVLLVAASALVWRGVRTLV